MCAQTALSEGGYGTMPQREVSALMRSRVRPDWSNLMDPREVARATFR